MKQSFYLSGCMCIVLLAGACRTSGIQPQKNQNMDSQIIVTTTSPKGGTASIVLVTNCVCLHFWKKAIGWIIGALAEMVSFFPIHTRSIVNWVVHPLWRN